MIRTRCVGRGGFAAVVVLLLGVLLVGCGGQDQGGSPDAKTVEAHRLKPPMPSAVPKGMNK